MKFTFWAVGVPLLLIILDAILLQPTKGKMHMDALGWIGGLWFLGGCVFAFWFWVVRFFRFIWRSTEQRSSGRPAGWIYPDER